MDAIAGNFTEFAGHSLDLHREMAAHSRQPFQIATTCVMLALGTPAVILRLWVRKHFINSLGMDDFMMVVALVTDILHA